LSDKSRRRRLANATVSSARSNVVIAWLLPVGVLLILTLRLWLHPREPVAVGVAVTVGLCLGLIPVRMARSMIGVGAVLFGLSILVPMEPHETFPPTHLPIDAIALVMYGLLLMLSTRFFKKELTHRDSL
jgi:hypothetical protein